jgi:DNA-binding Xre family transcriptional regulator
MLKQVAQAKGYHNPKQLTEAMKEHFGINMSNSALYPYWNDNVTNFSRVMLDRLCDFLDVPPGLLIQYIDMESLKRK